MTTKSRQRIYGASIRASAQRAKEARKEADRLACEAWNMRLPGFTGRRRCEAIRPAIYPNDKLLAFLEAM
jgi:hypothetical protein